MRTSTGSRLSYASALLLCLGASLCAQQITVIPHGGTLTVQLQPYQGSILRNSAPVLPGTSTVNISREAIATSTIGVRTSLRCEANGPPSGGHGGWSSAAGQFGVLYQASAPLAGILRLTMSPACFMNPAYFDVGADGVYELIGHGGSLDVPVVLGRHPLIVEVFNEVVNFAPGLCVGTSTIEFLPTATKLMLIGSTCGPDLSGSLVTRSGGAHELTCHASAVALPMGVYVFGTTPASWAFACPLLTQIDVAIAVAPMQGHAEYSVQLPSQVSGQLRIQYIELGLQPFALATSNGLLLRLP